MEYASSSRRSPSPAAWYIAVVVTMGFVNCTLQYGVRDPIR
jgi:hypothetical protein